MLEGEKRDDTLPIEQNGEEEMADLICDWCGKTRELNHRLSMYRHGEDPDVIRGVLTCRECGGKTIFGMTNNAVSFYPTKSAYGQLQNAPGEVRDRFLDAELCYYGTGFRGAVAMSRATVEQALKDKGHTKGNLEDKIDAALKAGDLTERESMLAHGSRLVGNAALHKAKTIEPSDVPSVLSAAVSIVNHLFS